MVHNTHNTRTHSLYVLSEYISLVIVSVSLLPMNVVLQMIKNCILQECYRCCSHGWADSRKPWILWQITPV